MRRLIVCVFAVLCAPLQFALAGENPSSAAAELSRERLAGFSLEHRQRFIRQWVIEVALPELGAAAAGAEPKFAGVVAVGRKVLALDHAQPVDVQREFYATDAYWRGVMEMEPGNQLVAAVPALLHLANGEWDRAQRAFELLKFHQRDGTLAGSYLDQARELLEPSMAAVDREIQRGIALHGERRYAEAKAVYTAILAADIRSAWARYELFYSDAHENDRAILRAIASGADESAWNSAAAEIYRFNPLYTTQLLGRRGKDMAALKDRLQLRLLGQKPPPTLAGFLSEYAQLALNLQDYPTAAQLYWMLGLTKGATLSSDEILTRYLYCLEKLGATTVKENFKGKFAKKFQKLDQALAQHRAQ